MIAELSFKLLSHSDLKPYCNFAHNAFHKEVCIRQPTCNCKSRDHFQHANLTLCNWSVDSCCLIRSYCQGSYDPLKPFKNEFSRLVK